MRRRKEQKSPHPVEIIAKLIEFTTFVIALVVGFLIMQDSVFGDAPLYFSDVAFAYMLGAAFGALGARIAAAVREKATLRGFSNHAGLAR